MYTNNLPYDINKELCRLLDVYEYWKSLAGDQMKLSPFDIHEIQQAARYYNISPTHQLLKKWGQRNHNVKELFLLLYRMKHVPALRCLESLVDEEFRKLLKKLVEKLAPLPSSLASGNTSSTMESSNYSSSSSSRNSTSNEDGKFKSMAVEISRNVSSTLMIQYEELRAATDNWCETNLLGTGGFGQVFKGKWKHLPVAIKRLHDDKGRSLGREMCLDEYRHENIVPLYGYSFRGPEACLVYQLMLGGSLEQRLKGKTHHPPLSWPQRYRIAHGVARGLQYLHNVGELPLIHGDIKPGNILLDQHHIPKIGDFGLARKGLPGECMHRVIGTRPYLPDEYLRSNVLSPAVDVFSFGVVLLEMATALPPMDKSRSSIMLSAYVSTLTRTQMDFAVLEDPALRETTGSNPQLCGLFIEMGLQCTCYHHRPSMLDVYKTLDDSINTPDLPII